MKSRAGQGAGRDAHEPELGARVDDASTWTRRSVDDRRSAPKKSSKLWLGALILIGGGAAMAGYLIKRNARRTPRRRSKVVEVERDAGARSAARDHRRRAHRGVTDGSAGPPMLEPLATIDAGVIDDAAVAMPRSRMPASTRRPPSDRWRSTTAIDEEEIQIDPAKVEDPDTAAGSAAPPEDEDENAPKTEAGDREARARRRRHRRSRRRSTVRSRMIKAGKKELALASLRQLWKKQPNSGYIPFLLGNLYFDKKWWSVSMDHYRAAIKKNAGYRQQRGPEPERHPDAGVDQDPPSGYELPPRRHRPAEQALPELGRRARDRTRPFASRRRRSLRIFASRTRPRSGRGRRATARAFALDRRGRIHKISRSL